MIRYDPAAMRSNEIFARMNPEAALAFREKLGVPHIHSVFFSRKSIDGWRKSDPGLDLRDWLFQAVTQCHRVRLCFPRLF